MGEEVSREKGRGLHELLSKHMETQEGLTSKGHCNCLCSQMFVLKHLVCKIRLQSRWYWIRVRISCLIPSQRQPSCGVSHIYPLPAMHPLSHQWRSEDEQLQTARTSHSAVHSSVMRVIHLWRLFPTTHAAAHGLNRADMMGQQAPPGRYTTWPHCKIKTPAKHSTKWQKITTDTHY